MTRHTTFRFCLDPTVEQQKVLSRHTGAARFAFNQCLRLHLRARAAQRRHASVVVPWTGFDLINVFNAWKKTEHAGRVFCVGADGDAELRVTGLAWRSGVCQQVFEEAAVDLGKALKAWTDFRCGNRAGRKVGYPRFKKKNRGVESFRLRNRHPKSGRPAIRVGDTHPRSVTLPGIGTVRVHDDTRRLRRLIAKGRGKVLFATISNRAGRWWISLNVEAADLHPTHRHPARADGDHGGWVGVDRGLSVLAVAATRDGTEVARISDPPQALATGMQRQRQLARAVTRKPKGSKNRRKAASRLKRHHHRVSNIRKHFLHQVTNRLVKIHDRLVIEDLNVTGMLRNLAAWAEKNHSGGTAQVRDPQAGGPVTNAHRQERSGRHPRDGETDLDDVGTDVQTAPAA